LEVLGVDEWILFHWMLKEWNEREWNALSGSEYEQNRGCFEYGNRFSGSIRREIFLTCWENLNLSRRAICSMDLECLVMT